MNLKEQGGLFGRALMEEMKGGKSCNSIIISKPKLKMMKETQ